MGNVGLTAHPGESFDNDGDDDFYVINLGYPVERNQLFRNDINTQGVFTEVSVTSESRPIASAGTQE